MNNTTALDSATYMNPHHIHDRISLAETATAGGFVSSAMTVLLLALIRIIQLYRRRRQRDRNLSEV